MSLAKSDLRRVFNKMLAKAKLDKQPWHHKPVHRIYCEQSLNIRIKPRKRLASGEAKILMQPIHANVCWSLDFMSDALYGGCRFRTLNVLDDHNREGLLVEPCHSLPASTVTALLEQLAGGVTSS